MTAASLNALFAHYKDALGTDHAGDILSALISEATRHVWPLRRTFPGSDRVNGELYDDTVQDTILRLTGSAGNIRPESFAALLRESVRHALIDRTRRLKRRRDNVTLSALAEEEIFGREEPAPSDVEALKEKITAVSRCPPEAVAAWKDHADGMKLREIAERDGVPLDTVKSRVKAVYQALRNHPKLERELAEYGPGELAGLELIGERGRG